MHITYINSDYQKIRGFASGLALGRRGVNCVSQERLWDLLLHENLLVLLNNLLELMITGGHDLRRLILYMHAIMMMQQFSI